MAPAVMRQRRRTYWQQCVSDTDRAKDAIKSWFSPMCEGMTPYKAEILCDVETDAEKRLRAFMVDEQGQHFAFTRSRSGRDIVVSMKRLSGDQP